MTYFTKKGVQKNIAALMLTLMLAETLLPTYALSRNFSAIPFQHSYQNVERSSGNLPPTFKPLEFAKPLNDLIGTSELKVPTKEKKKTFIGGPGQPEMSSFKSVNADNMVDLFTGDFSYNIPLLDVGGYPVNIHYNGGPTIDQEASWVGLGWNINPGTIGRSMRGIPDDFNGEDKITRTQRIRQNKTTGVSVGGNLELFGGVLNLGISAGVFKNTYNGWGVEYGINPSINAGSGSKGSLTASLGLNNNSQSGFNVTPSLSMRLTEKDNFLNGSASIGANYNSRTGLSGLQFSSQVSATIDKNLLDNQKKDYNTSSNSGPSGSISYATPAYTPSIRMPLTSTNYAFTAKYGGEVWGLFGNVHIGGYVSQQQVADEDTTQSLPAFGFLYYTKGKDSAQALLDLSREKEIYFNAKSTPHIAVPQYTNDIYTISGEGIGGMFRPYRSEVGYVRDHYMQTKSNSGNLGVNLGGGLWFKGGLDVDVTIATTKNSVWKNSVNPNLEFQNADTTFQPVYFKNPGEKSSNSQDYYRAVGGDSTVRIKLTGKNENITTANAFVAYYNKSKVREINIDAPILKKQRDKRTQVITYKTAEEADHYGLDKKIIAVKENCLPQTICPDTTTLPIDRVDDALRRKHHISEIDVLNTDGRRYVYGLPAYNAEQVDVTFSIDKETEQTKVDRGIADYEAEKDNHAITNKKGKENFFTKDRMPSYTHSFLLTALLSSDYVDITGDGVSDDDLGDAVKFNYSQIYGKESKTQNYYGWRTPNEQTMVSYDEGLKTYSRDDKGTYMYGQKEVWYLNSIASKTMLAVFRISDKREDDLGIKDENGGVDGAQKMRRLERIDLYSKPDLIRHGDSARPIKSVHFEYDYSQCRNTVNNSGNPVDKNGNTVSEGSSSNVNKNKGKLTLKKIWFSYNGNYKGVKNPYTFNYGQVEGGQAENKYNPQHNSKNYDRWGSYKDPASNPAGLNNVDYPYSVKDTAKAREYANAWQLTNIKLPSGGIMKISYEADDYGYVQNKRAMQMFSIAGFGSTSSSTPEKKLYKSDDPRTENEYMFIDVPEPVSNKLDIYQKYLEGVKKIYCKLAVQMPQDQWGGGYETVPTYVNIDQDNYGVVSGNSNRIWIKLAKVDSRQPLAMAALQFMRLNIPAKAYPASELTDDLSFESTIRLFAVSWKEVESTVKGFYDFGKQNYWCQLISSEKSFVRLDAPLFKKFGGGYRVKRVEVFDNWNQMTGQKEASYGQQYSYKETKVITRQIVVSGVTKLVKDTISISSGVATYEPFIGAEENPFREPIEYDEKISVLAPKNYMYSENPLGESFFDAPMVGYSKVRVRTINTKAKSASGWQESEFYTSKDFPTIVDHTLFDGESKKPFNPKLRELLNLNRINNITTSQGFKVELNDMNGKLKSQVSYAENDSLNPLQFTKNFYRVDDDRAKVPHLNNTVWVADSLNGNVNKNAVMGLDIEMMTDMREQYSKTQAGSLQTNIDVIPLVWFPLVVGTFIPNYHREENTFRSVATVKIIHRYGILDSVVVIDKGSIVSTKNMVYDAETGDAIVTRTNNEFDDPVYQFNYPAHWAYSGMGTAYKNIDAVFSNKLVIKGKMYNADKGTFSSERFFESGDEIWISSCSVKETVANVAGDCPTYQFSGDTSGVRIWAIDAAKGKEKNKGLYFIDEDGKPFHGFINAMKIIRSGKRNMLSASVGQIVSLADPVKEISSGKFKIVIDSNINIINTAATTYKDLWQVEKSFYVKDSVVRVYRDFDLTATNPQISIARFNREGAQSPAENTIYAGIPFIGASFDYIESGDHNRSRTLLTKSIINFNLDAIPTDAIITEANIFLSPKIARNYWVRKSVKKDWPWSGTLFSYEWKNANTYYLNSSQASLKLLTTPWNANTSYTSLNAASSPSVAVYRDSLSRYCTELIQSYINRPISTRYGLVFELNKNHQTSDGTSETNYLTLCAGDQTDANRLSGLECGSIVHSGEGISCDCFSPRLVVYYKAYVDSIVHLCKENINDTATNPYRWGILGNWRAERAYTWYSDRKENDAAITTTDIRKEGVLKQFTSFWSFSDSGLVNTADTSKWVWNATSSIYNRRGFEIENYDPLGRYNAGLYGYAQSLPVAVAQNSRYREILYDGFEDYNYRNEACIPFCEKPRAFDFVKDQTGVTVDSLQHHTGKYSIKITQGYESLLNASVSKRDSLLPAVSIDVDSTPVYTTKVIGAGTGITGKYEQTAYEATHNGCFSGTGGTNTRTETELNLLWGYATPFSNICGSGAYTAKWEGKFQAPTTDRYTLFLNTQGGSATLSINNLTVLFSNEDHKTIPLIAGQLYTFRVDYLHTPNSGFGLRLAWFANSLNLPTGVTSQTIPTKFLYPLSTVTAPPESFATNISTYCISLNNVKGERIISPVFAPIQSKKIVVSTWMKMDGEDCNTIPVLQNTLRVGFNGSVTDTLEKTGVRIEGWQRYEKAITIPANATSIFLSLKGSATKTVYIDDVRVQPYNSSMKSFAYDAVSLRLMAELDENNYASFYEYDNDGTLIRVKKETVKGIQTIKETRSAMIREE